MDTDKLMDIEQYTAWIEVDPEALSENYQRVQEHVGGTGVIPVIKANGYGLGAVVCARIYETKGAKLLAVTRVEEAVELREAGIQTDILLLTPFTKTQIDLVLRYRLTPAISALWQAQALEQAAVSAGVKLFVHLKVETGLGRTGFLLSAFEQLLDSWPASSHLFIQGLFSHLAAAHRTAYTQKQHMAFESFLLACQERNLSIPMIHLANSAGALLRKELLYTHVRVGTLLYGQFPPHTNKPLVLKNPFVVYARVLSINTVKAGSSIGYGLDVVAKKPALIAVLGIGWSDGVSVGVKRRQPTWSQGLRQVMQTIKRLVTNDQLYVKIHDRSYRFIGRIGMQTATILVDDAVSVGDVATIPMMRLLASARLPRVIRYQDLKWTQDQWSERMQKRDE